MTTLEDKLLGEKQHYYCSSSEGEDEDGCDKGGINTVNSKLGSVDTTDTIDCTLQPTPASGYHYQCSSNTGPKGVVKDWQYCKKLQAEQREEDEWKRVAMAKKMTMTTVTSQEDEERKRNKEIDDELAELMSEDFLQQFQKKRMAEMLKQNGQMRHFGHVYNLNTHKDFLDCIETENKYTIVIIHIYDRAMSVCTQLNKCLDTLAIDYPNVKFAKICCIVAGMSREFCRNGLPALLVYKGQAVIGNFVRLTDYLTDDFFTSDLESFLIENAILTDNNLFK